MADRSGLGSRPFSGSAQWSCPPLLRGPASGPVQLCGSPMPAHPLLSAGDVADLLGTSERSARTALSALASRGILSPIDIPTSTPGRTRHWFTAPDLLHV